MQHPMYTHLSGPFDYNKMPLAPMGCAVQVHEKTDKRGTWAYHSVDGWYLATSPEHYCTHRCHITSTRSERFTDTVKFSHKKITRPTVTHADKAMTAIADWQRHRGNETISSIDGTGYPTKSKYCQGKHRTSTHTGSSEGAIKQSRSKAN